jgi:hypothetical protein
VGRRIMAHHDELLVEVDALAKTAVVEALPIGSGGGNGGGSKGGGDSNRRVGGHCGGAQFR